MIFVSKIGTSIPLRLLRYEAQGLEVLGLILKVTTQEKLCSFSYVMNLKIKGYTTAARILLFTLNSYFLL